MREKWEGIRELCLGFRLKFEKHFFVPFHAENSLAFLVAAFEKLDKAAYAMLKRLKDLNWLLNSFCNWQLITYLAMNLTSTKKKQLKAVWKYCKSLPLLHCGIHLSQLYFRSNLVLFSTCTKILTLTLHLKLYNSILRNWFEFSDKQLYF